MNTAESNQEKRTIKVRDFLDNFRSGMTDRQLMEKYHLTESGLDKFYGMLIDRGILDPQEFQSRTWEDEPFGLEPPSIESDKARFVCPACLSSQETMFDTCPNCGTPLGGLAHSQVAQADPLAVARDRQGEEPGIDSSFASDQREDLKETPTGPSVAGRHDGRTEIPRVESKVVSAFEGPPKKSEAEGYAQPDDFEKPYSEFDDPLDQVVPGMPLDFVDHSEDEISVAPRCEYCNGVLDAGVRTIYERKGSLVALAMSTIFLFMGFLGAVCVTVFAGYSAARLVVIYFTGLSLLFGCILLALAMFMLFLAREKAYLCYSCSRIYPRV
jgi:hypothetical protein